MPLGTRHMVQDLAVVVPVQTRTWDPTEGRYVIATAMQTVWTGKGLWQASLRIEDPTPPEVGSERLAIMRGRAYFPTSATLSAALATDGAKIRLPDGSIVEPIMRPKDMGGRGRRTRVDTGTFVK